MYGQQQREIQKLEGRTVNVALADGSFLDRVPLVLARRGRVWVVKDGEDTFLPLDRIVRVFDAPPFRASAVSGLQADVEGARVA